MTARQLFLLFVRLHRAAVLLEGTSGPVAHEVTTVSRELQETITKLLARPHRTRRRAK